MIEEITRGINRFSDILAVIDDCNKEGFPYRDGSRAKIELQLRETIRQVFGEGSKEFQTHRDHQLLISTGAETAQSIELIKSLIESLDRQKRELLGITPAAPAPEPDAAAPRTKPQLTLTPPAASAPVMISEPSAVLTTPPARPKGSLPVPAAYLPTSQISVAVPAAKTSVSMPSAPPAPAITSAPIPAATYPANPATSFGPIWTATSPSTTTRDNTPANPAQPAPPSSSPETPINTAWARTTETVARPSFQTEKPAVPPTLPTLPPTAHPVTTAPMKPVPQVNADPLPGLRKICTRFHAVARQLRLRKDYRSTLDVEDDCDLHDLLCALLKLEFEEVGSDEWTPPDTGGSPRTALLIDKDRTAIIAKKTRPGLTAKELAEHVSADAQRYAARAHCANLFYFIYDPEGRIGNPKRLETDLSSVNGHFIVEVVIAPK